MHNIIKYIFIKLARYVDFKRRTIHVAKGTYIENQVTIGRFTRINAKSHIGNCEIGSFCAIAGRLVVRSRDHHVNFLNMQAYLQDIVLKCDNKVTGKLKGQVTIGNGVWIGDSVIILPGVCVGDGAVVGAGSVVTKNIPEFSIAVGNPAKVIKYRFSSDKIKLIKKLDYWNWTENKIKMNKSIFEIDISKASVFELEEILESVKKQ